jgi:ketosteroid isomerase-like protein
MSDKNIDIVKEIFAAFGRGDVPAIMEHVSDDLHGFGIVTQEERIPWHVQINKKQDVPKFFQAIAESSEFTRFEPRDFAAGGDHVYCTVSFEVIFRHNRAQMTVDNEMHRFTFKNGKVVEWRGTEDTAWASAVYNRK